VPGSAGQITWSGAAGTSWWADPAEELAVVFMAHSPSPTVKRRNYQLIQELVLQAVVD